MNLGMLNGFATGVSCALALLDIAITLPTIKNKNVFILAEIEPFSLWRSKCPNKRFSTDDFNWTLRHFYTTLKRNFSPIFFVTQQFGDGEFAYFIIRALINVIGTSDIKKI